MGEPHAVDDMDIDSEWEKFSKDGCPDWWLMARYTSGWLASLGFPYMPFRDRPLIGTGATRSSSSSPEAEMHQATTQTEAPEASSSSSSAAAGGTSVVAATAAGSNAAAAGPDRCSSLDVPSTPPAAPTAPVVCSDAATSSSNHGEAHSHTCPQSAGTATAAGGGAAGGCGNPLKGLFACQCVANTSCTDTAVDQAVA